jgi:hypothetical protein
MRARPLICAVVGLLLGFGAGIVGLKIDLSANPALYPTDWSNQVFAGTVVNTLVLRPFVGLLCGYLVGMGYGAYKR